MAIRTERIDELIATSGSSLIGPDGLAKELTRALVERMLYGCRGSSTWPVRLFPSRTHQQMDFRTPPHRGEPSHRNQSPGTGFTLP